MSLRRERLRDRDFYSCHSNLYCPKVQQKTSCAKAGMGAVLYVVGRPADAAERCMLGATTVRAPRLVERSHS